MLSSRKWDWLWSPQRIRLVFMDIQKRTFGAYPSIRWTHSQAKDGKERFASAIKQQKDKSNIRKRKKLFSLSNSSPQVCLPLKDWLMSLAWQESKSKISFQSLLQLRKHANPASLYGIWAFEPFLVKRDHQNAKNKFGKIPCFLRNDSKKRSINTRSNKRHCAICSKNHKRYRFYQKSREKWGSKHKRNGPVVPTSKKSTVPSRNSVNKKSVKLKEKSKMFLKAIGRSIGA